MTTRAITRSIELPAPPATVFGWLVTPRAICRWWGAERALVIPELGGYWMAAWGASPDAPDYVTAARLTQYDPPNRLALGETRYAARAGPLPFAMAMTIEFRLEAVGPGTRLTVVQDGIPADSIADEYHAACLQGWTDTLAGLSRLADDPSG